MKRLLGALAFAALFATAATPAFADLITNGGFETGDFTGWTGFNGGNPGNEQVVTDFGLPFLSPHSGTYFALLGSQQINPAATTLSQTVADTPGQTLTLSFWLGSTGTPNDFSVLWNGGVIPGSTLTDFGPTDYTKYVFNVLATGSDTLMFSLHINLSDFTLDDVSLNPATPASVPEPSTLALLATGLLAAGAMRTRKRALSPRSPICSGEGSGVDR